MKFCDQNKLPTRERLDLFIAVCHAIQHAHQKGIIHRDIKPSNILVTLDDGVPVPKVIDFGVAKAIQSQRLTDLTFFTRFEQMIGTPLYMSPEQAEMSGLDIGTRSDIYSLGVLLYELLTGQTPFDAKELMASGLDEMRKTIREKEPVRPSTKLSQTLAATELVGRITPCAPLGVPPSGGPDRVNAGLQTADGARGATRPTSKSEEEVKASSRGLLQIKERFDLVRGDLDWIVMKCLEKDRTRRYETATGLSADLKRHLNNEPVIARPPSAAYKLQKAWRRNKVAFTAAVAVAIALVVGISLSTWQAFEARRARDAAQSERDKAQTAQTEAESAQQAEKKARLRADAEVYVANMNLAGQAWEKGNYGQLRQLLAATRNSPDRGLEWYYWQRQAHLNLQTLRGHTGGVTSTAFSPDGRCIVTGSFKLTAQVWDADTRKELLTIRDIGPINSVALSPDGQRIATGNWISTASVWDADTGRKLLSIRGHEKAVSSVAFSPDSQRIATAGGDATAKVWEASSERESRLLRGNSPDLLAVAISPDGQGVGRRHRSRSAHL